MKKVGAIGLEDSRCERLPLSIWACYGRIIVCLYLRSFQLCRFLSFGESIRLGRQEEEKIRKNCLQFPKARNITFHILAKMEENDKREGASQRCFFSHSFQFHNKICERIKLASFGVLMIAHRNLEIRMKPELGNAWKQKFLINACWPTGRTHEPVAWEEKKTVAFVRILKKIFEKEALAVIMNKEDKNLSNEQKINSFKDLTLIQLKWTHTSYKF